ncbi:MAG: glycerophosphodiester phosphodiesterase [Deltaproteobacteria bacterium]|nr:glycerophosphodiester phosphodiesterase [Deltaproteobacteria bacterium]MBW2444736.1 glycerophosphodiester phosphodiesterase [Deltaproteobacteria bacterium]
MGRPERPLVIAHRGSSGHRPENTRPAFELAVEHRADMIETDLHVTRDGVVVLSHDAELEHLGAEGQVSDRTLAELHTLDAGGGERVPRLDETLDSFGPRIPWNLEFKKPVDGFYEGVEAEALAAVESRGLLDLTLFSCFYDPVLERLRALSPGARIALLISRRFPDRAVQRAQALGAEAINPEASITTPELVEEAHAAGLAVYVFTVDPAGEMRRFLEMGVDGLFTNLPDRMYAILHEDS